MMIFFDIDDTLIDSELAHKKAVKKIFSHYYEMPDTDTIFQKWIDLTNRYLKLYFENKISLTGQRTARIKELFEIFGHSINDEEAMEIYFRYHQCFLASCKVFPETIPVLEQLKGVQMGIITNGPVADQTKKLIDNALIGYFDPVVISEEVGCSKPRKEIFDIAAARASRVPSDCVFVGDSYELDYLGGKNAGMKTFWLDRKGTQTNSHCDSVRSLQELISYLSIS